MQLGIIQASQFIENSRAGQFWQERAVIKSVLVLASGCWVLGIGSRNVLKLERKGFQPSPHELALPGLAAVGFEAIALALSTPVIGKKKFLAVQALGAGLWRLHRFQIEKEPVWENGAKPGKKIQRKKIPF